MHPDIDSRLKAIRNHLDHAQRIAGELGLNLALTNYDAREALYVAQSRINEARRQLGILEVMDDSQ